MKNVQQKVYPSSTDVKDATQTKCFSLLCSAFTKKIRDRKFKTSAYVSVNDEIRLLGVECPACKGQFAVDDNFIRKVQETNFKYACPYCQICCNIVL